MFSPLPPLEQAWVVPLLSHNLLADLIVFIKG